MMAALGRAWTRGRSYLASYEPARAKAGWTALIALLATQGISISTGVDGKVQSALAVLSIVLPWVQGELTRRAVYSPAAARQVAVDAAERAQDPDVTPERAAVAALAAPLHMRPEEG